MYFSCDLKKFGCGPVLALVLILSGFAALAQHSTNDAVAQAELGMKKFQVAADLKVDLFAAEPMLENPVSFSVDERGRFFVAETHRYGISILDITQNQPWLLNDLSFRTVEDRTAFLLKAFATNQSILTKDSEMIRLVEDRSGDGKADKSSVFADGFNQVPSGVAAGVLARHGTVWAACIPDLWEFSGVDAQGKAHGKQKLFTGFGVHIGVTGHDLHGLRIGPDGKLYMSSGDRGFVVKTKEGKVLNNPDTGAVLRCNPDGSDLEIVCTGLRNPQELAFDQFGNLFTDDNDTAGEDHSRVIYVVEGADYGWRCSYQHMSGFGPWDKELVWMGNIDDALPWCGYVSQGPSGLAFYPGTGLPERYDNHFLVCDFPGGVRSFAVKRSGASYEAVDNEKFLWNLWPSDVDFGPDSCVYVCDWVEGWQMPHKGRLYRISDPSLAGGTAAAEVKRILREGMDKRSLKECAALLEHRDMRVRLEAQYSLAERGRKAIATLAQVASGSANQLARLHAIWGLGQIGGRVSSACAPLVPLLSANDAEVRAQAAKVLGDGKYQPAFDELLYLLTGPAINEDRKNEAGANAALAAEPRPKFFAAMAMAKLKDHRALVPILDMLRSNDDHDPYLTHAGVMALLGIGDIDAIKVATRDSSVAVRRAALHCLRRLGDPAVAQMLNDEEPKLAVEAARAVNDLPINAAMPELAGMLSPSHERLWSAELIKQQWDADKPVGKSIHSETGWRHVPPYEQLLLRAINANYRLGQSTNAEAVAAFAAREDSPPAMRAAALDALGDWAKPSPIDRIMGLWRPLPERPVGLAREAVNPVIEKLLSASEESVMVAAAQCAAKLQLHDAGAQIALIFSKAGAPPSERIAMLQALADLQDDRLAVATKSALADADPAIQREGIKVLSRTNVPEAPQLLEKFLAAGGDLRLSQAAYDALGVISNAGADDVLCRELAKCSAGLVKPELELDLVEAAEKKTSGSVKQALLRYGVSRPSKDELKGYRKVLYGGDAIEGRKIFTERAGVECARCHALRGKGGVVGPDLAGVGKRQSREYLLESILLPNKQIAKGFENVTVVLKSGASVAGVLKSEDEKELVINSPEDGEVKVAKDEIKTRQRGLSAMPEEISKMLSKEDLRNLVEFLAGLK